MDLFAYSATLWGGRGTEVVITGRTRNAVAPKGARGFESHPLRQKEYNTPYKLLASNNCITIWKTN